jgi:hypothetical protein
MDCYRAMIRGQDGKDSFREKMRRLSIAWSDLQKRLVVMSIDCSDLNRIVVKETHPG